MKFVPPGGILRHLGLAVVVDDLEVLLVGLNLFDEELGPQAFQSPAEKARFPPTAFIWI